MQRGPEPSNSDRRASDATGLSIAPASSAERRVQAVVLVPWASAVVGLAWFAGDLERMPFPWPLHYWLAAQGVIGFFVLLAVINVRAMRRIDGDDDAADPAAFVHPRDH